VGDHCCNVIRVMRLDANDSLVRNLQIQSEKLEDMREGFSGMLAAKSFYVYTFQEALGIPRGARFDWKVNFPTVLLDLF